MTIENLLNEGKFKVINQGEDLSVEISKPFCCDLLSIAMSKTPAGSAWVTVMGNVNTLAVASLTEAACVILAEGAAIDEMASQKAKAEGITVLQTEEPIFETAVQIASIMERLG